MERVVIAYIYFYQIHVVYESRVYSSWSDTCAPGGVCASTGIIAAKRLLNDLHHQLGKDGFSQVTYN